MSFEYRDSRSGGNLTFDSSQFTATSDFGGSLSMDDFVIAGTFSGGVASSFGGSIVLDDFIISGTFAGGGVSAFGGAAVLDDFIISGAFSGGASSGFGGVVVLDDFTLVGTFDSQAPASFGGAVQLSSFTISGVFSGGSSGGLDPTSLLGRVRLKIGDYSDLPILPDSVIYAALAECNNNVNRASQLCAQYILGALTAKTHKRLSQLETWSGEQFTNYVQFLRLTILNPNLTTVAPIPYGGNGSEDHSIQQFVQDTRDGYLPGSVVVPPQQGGRVIQYAFS